MNSILHLVPHLIPHLIPHTLQRLAAGLLALSALLAAATAQAQVGMARAELAGMPVTLVYPSAAPTRHLSPAGFDIDVAMDAAPTPGRHRLIVMSHGTGGSALSDHALAATLARAGFVVAQPQHAGDNHADLSQAGPVAWDTRPREVSAVIDALAASPRWQPLLQLDKVGVHGMSAGGGTALVMAGARWRVLDLVRHCAEHGVEDEGFCFNGAAGPAARAERQAAFERARNAPEAYLPAMVTAAFECAERLFGLRFTARTDLAGYHPDVAVYQVDSDDGTPVGLFLQDNFARPAKRSGAWMSTLAVQHRNATDGVPGLRVRVGDSDWPARLPRDHSGISETSRTQAVRVGQVALAGTPLYLPPEAVAGAPPSPIEVADVPHTECLHEAGRAVFVGGGREQVDVVVVQPRQHHAPLQIHLAGGVGHEGFGPLARADVAKLAILDHHGLGQAALAVLGVNLAVEVEGAGRFLRAVVLLAAAEQSEAADQAAGEGPAGLGGVFAIGVAPLGDVVVLHTQDGQAVPVALVRQGADVGRMARREARCQLDQHLARAVGRQVHQQGVLRVQRAPVGGGRTLQHLGHGGRCGWHRLVGGGGGGRAAGDQGGPGRVGGAKGHRGSWWERWRPGRARRRVVCRQVAPLAPRADTVACAALPTAHATMTPFHALRIETPRLLLRPLEDSDADSLWAIFSDPAVMRYWSTPPWTDRERATSLIASDREALQERRDLRLGLVLRDGGLLVGTLSLYKIDAPCRRADIGYALGAAHQGQGLMNEALSAVVDLAFDHRPGTAFDDLRLNRIEADIDPRNAASCRALERLGFRHEGTLRERWWVAGEVSDTALYGLIRSDWHPGG
mgnify:CR=1 FL=1